MTAVRAVKAGESLSEITAPVEFFNDLDGLWEGISSADTVSGMSSFDQAADDAGSHIAGADEGYCRCLQLCSQ